MGISTHVLDTETGRPAVGVRVRLERRDDAGESVDLWSEVAAGVTDADGRCRTWIAQGTAAGTATRTTVGTAQGPGSGGEAVAPGVYRVRFETAAYFAQTGREGLYPWVEIAFAVRDERHHHIPLLLAANGYSTYRGS